MGGSVAARSLIFLEHDFGGLDYRLHLVTLLETKLFGTPARDHALDVRLADFDHHMRHDVAEHYLDDLTFKLIACR